MARSGSPLIFKVSQNSGFCFVIELKFCIWLCSNESQIKFAFRQILSNFEGVMPLFRFRICDIEIVFHTLFLHALIEVLS